MKILLNNRRKIVSYDKTFGLFEKRYSVSPPLCLREKVCLFVRVCVLYVCMHLCVHIRVCVYVCLSVSMSVCLSVTYFVSGELRGVIIDVSDPDDSRSCVRQAIGWVPLHVSSLDD
jgi:hypothetical protein